MTVIFADEELKYIIKKKFNWHIKKDCPKELRNKIQRKLNLLKGEKNESSF